MNIKNTYTQTNARMHVQHIKNEFTLNTAQYFLFIDQKSLVPIFPIVVSCLYLNFSWWPPAMVHSSFVTENDLVYGLCVRHRCKCNSGTKSRKKGVISRKKNWKVWFDVKNIALAAYHDKYNDIMEENHLEPAHSMVVFLSCWCCWCWCCF